MSVASLISDGYLTIGANNTFSPAGNAQIIAALENLYLRSSNARSLIDSLAGGPEVLDISFKQDDAEADAGLFRVRIDPDSQYLYIASNGSALSDSLESVLLHEIYHAVNDIHDVIVPIDGSIPREPDEYRGQTVIATNSAMDQYFSSVGGYEDRLTYSAYIRVGQGFQPFQNGQNYTFGNQIDVALIATASTVGHTPTDNPNTSRNTTGTRDLIFGNSDNNLISTGLGNDFIYGGIAFDTIYGGAGNDYIDGGADSDTISYEGFLGDASGVSQSNIWVWWSDQGVQVGDQWDSIDTIIRCEVLIATAFDDNFSLRGNFGALTSLGNDYAPFSWDAGEGNEVEGDTLDLDTDSGLTIDLLNWSINNGSGGAVEVKHFENVIGSNHSDTILGDDELNVIKGRGGNDLIFGGQDGSPPQMGAPAVLDKLDGGSGNDTITAGQGRDSVFGGSGDDDLIENVDVANQMDGGDLYGESGADLIDVSASVDASNVYGGSGNDTLFGNGASVLYGGSGVDEFLIVTSSSVPGASGDTIVDAEAVDTLWINGIEVTETSADIIFGIEVGGPGGGPWYLPRSQGGQGFEHGANATAPLGIVFRVTGLAEDFTGLRQDMLVDMYIFTNVSLGPINSFGGANATEQFYLNEAVTVIRGVHLGDFGLFGNGGPTAEGIHNSTYVRGRLVHDGIDYIYGYGLVDGPPRTLNQETIEQEALVERFREQFEDVPQLENVQVANATGSSNDDVFVGDDASGSFTGGTGNDQVFGGGGGDTILAGLGADVGSGGDGADTLSGEDGDDILFGDASPVTQFQSSTFEAADSISGGNGSDRLYGNGGADTLQGEEGNDVAYGGEGNDTIFGGAGADSADGGAGMDLLQGDDGNDTLQGGLDADSVFGGNGDDEVRGGAGVDFVYGGAGNDGVIGGEGNDSVYGGDGSDSLLGAVGDDTLIGGTGHDDLQGGSEDDTYIYAAGDGNDIIFDSGSYLDIDTITFTDIASTAVQFGRVNDDLVIYINDGSQITIRSHYRVSNESVELAHFSDAVTVDLLTVPVQTSVLGTVGDDYLFGVNTTTAELMDGFAGNDSMNAYGGNDSVYGGDGNDTLQGGSGNDFVYGGSGDDFVDGGTGSDIAFGGTGNDTFNVDSTADIINENAGEGTDFVQSSVTWTLAASVENLTLTGTTSIDGTGNSLDNLIVGNSPSTGLFGSGGANRLFGLGGNDTLIGGGGADTIDGGGGADSMVGGDASDTFIVDDVLDLTVELSGQGVDLVTSAVSWTLDTYVENLTLTGSMALNGTGSVAGNVITGNAGANSLSGLAGNDTLVGGDGNDTLDGGSDTDSMTGGLGDDIYIADSAVDKAIEIASGGIDTVQSSATFALGVEVENLTLTGSAVINGTGNTIANIVTGNNQANSLSGLAGNDTIFGGGGNDTLDGGTGSDSLVGGIGNDTYVIDALTDVVIEGLGEGIDLIQSSLALTLVANIENLTITGTSGISGSGNELANVLTGNTGANALSGAAGNDTLDGAAGNDTLDGGLGTDSLIGGAGNDTFVVDAATDVLVELAAGGTDLVQASLTWVLEAELENLTLTGSATINGTGNTVANLLTGNTGANLLSGLAGNDTLSAGDGNDTLDGGAGNDSLTGGLGDDFYIVDAATDVVVEAAAAGSDTVQSAATYTLATNVETLILTGAGVINGTGNTLNNVITGNAAANLLSGGTGNDTISGGGGNDTLVADAVGDVLIEAAAGGTDLVQASVVWTLGAEFENLTLTGTTSIAGTGNAVANILTGNTGANALSGAAGNDTLDGGAGADTLNGGLDSDSLIGGAGNDTFIVDVATDVLVELAAGGTDLVQASLTWTLGAELENLTLTGSAAINGTGNTVANVLTGNTGHNALYGAGGNDTLNGGTGNDTLEGGAGNDSMIGGAGDDLFFVDATTDVVSEATGGGTDTVQGAASFTLGLNIEHLVLTGTAAINGAGNSLANTITGNSAANLLSGSTGNDTLIGNDGNDTLDGGGGSDSLTGGAGNDAYVVDAALDAVVEAAAGGTDTVTSSIAYTLLANVENLLLSGTSAIAGTGNALANTLTGNTGANALSGLDGNDTLVGGGGNDALNGGIGADQFVFNSTTSGVDVIADFNELNGGGEEGDVLRFDGLNTGTFVYLGTSAFSGGSDNSEARVVGSQVLFDANGDGTADITITLTGLTAASQLAATDFLFV